MQVKTAVHCQLPRITQSIRYVAFLCDKLYPTALSILLLYMRMYNTLKRTNHFCNHFISFQVLI